MDQVVVEESRMEKEGVTRILVVEDDHVNAHVAKLILERLGCDVDIATTGIEAVELFRSNGYHLVLMDSDLPVMDGFEATRSIRTLEGGAATPILGTTASGERLRCINAGMNDVVPKPFERKKLRRVLEQWVRE